MRTARRSHTANLLADGRVLIAGGDFDSSYSPLASAELYDPSTGDFTATGTMTTARSRHTATLLRNGKVLIAGGGTLNRDGTVLGSAELYDPSTGVFTATGDMSVRAHHTATLLANGDVLIEGGGVTVSNNGVVRFDFEFPSAEIYNSDSGAFGPAAPSGHALPGMTATLLPSGKVLLALGTGSAGEPVSTAELYDPGTGTFTATGRMNALRVFQAATLLSDGTALIAGGGDVPDGILIYSPWSAGGAEVYDPATGAFSLTGRMSVGRSGHTATLLSDGTVLVAGGSGAANPSSQLGALGTAEIYHPPVVTPAPALLSLSEGTGRQGAVLHASTHQIVSFSNPAAAREALEVCCTGLAEDSVVPPQVAIGGRLSEILFFGKAPGLPGVNQVNVRLPSGVAAGESVPVRLTYLGRPSNEVTIGVK